MFLKFKIDLCYMSNSQGNFYFYLFLLFLVEATNFPTIVISSLLRIHREDAVHYLRVNEHLMTRRRIFGGILDAKSLQSLKTKRAICYPFSFIVHNSKPVGHQVVDILLVYTLTDPFSFSNIWPKLEMVL